MAPAKAQLSAAVVQALDATADITAYGARPRTATAVRQPSTTS